MLFVNAETLKYVVQMWGKKTSDIFLRVVYVVCGHMTFTLCGLHGDVGTNENRPAYRRLEGLSVLFRVTDAQMK